MPVGSLAPTEQSAIDIDEELSQDVSHKKRKTAENPPSSPRCRLCERTEKAPEHARKIRIETIYKVHTDAPVAAAARSKSDFTRRLEPVQKHMQGNT